jgi:drug/metabolite transporter (DMT)-like permease
MEVTPTRRKVYLAFITLAVLAGPVDQSVSSTYLIGSPLPTFHSFAIASVAGAAVLAVFALIRRERLPRRSECAALLVLLAPQLCFVSFGPNTTSFGSLHLGWGTALLLSVAAPLWLGLLSATNLIAVEVPRSVVGAAIIGIGAVCLPLPLDATGITLGQLPAILLNVLFGIATVASWAFTRPRLTNCPIISAAAVYLGASALGYAVFAVIYERSAWHSMDWRLPLAALLPEVASLVVSWCLWFWLLKSLPLHAFSMRMLANCAATLLPGFLSFGVAQWRMDAAFVISCVAVAVALRATPAEEQPMLLGLADS